jgi:hypothetical protein
MASIIESSTIHNTVLSGVVNEVYYMVAQFSMADSSHEPTAVVLRDGGTDTVGLVSGDWSWRAPVRIASVANAGGAGTAAFTTTRAHGLVINDYVTISGTTDYDGTFLVAAASTATTFTLKTSENSDVLFISDALSISAQVVQVESVAGVNQAATITNFATKDGGGGVTFTLDAARDWTANIQVVIAGLHHDLDGTHVLSDVAGSTITVDGLTAPSVGDVATYIATRAVPPVVSITPIIDLDSSASDVYNLYVFSVSLRNLQLVQGFATAFVAAVVENMSDTVTGAKSAVWEPLGVSESNTINVSSGLSLKFNRTHASNTANDAASVAGTVTLVAYDQFAETTPRENTVVMALWVAGGNPNTTVGEDPYLVKVREPLDSTQDVLTAEYADTVDGIYHKYLLTVQSGNEATRGTRDFNGENIVVVVQDASARVAQMNIELFYLAPPTFTAVSLGVHQYASKDAFQYAGGAVVDVVQVTLSNGTPSSTADGDGSFSITSVHYTSSSTSADGEGNPRFLVQLVGHSDHVSNTTTRDLALSDVTFEENGIDFSAEVRLALAGVATADVYSAWFYKPLAGAEFTLSNNAWVQTVDDDLLLSINDKDSSTVTVTWNATTGLGPVFVSDLQRTFMSVSASGGGADPGTILEEGAFYTSSTADASTGSLTVPLSAATNVFFLTASVDDTKFVREAYTPTLSSWVESNALSDPLVADLTAGGQQYIIWFEHLQNPDTLRTRFDMVYTGTDSRNLRLAGYQVADLEDYGYNVFTGGMWGMFTHTSGFLSVVANTTDSGAIQQISSISVTQIDVVGVDPVESVLVSTSAAHNLQAGDRVHFVGNTGNAYHWENVGVLTVLAVGSSTQFSLSAGDAHGSVTVAAGVLNVIPHTLLRTSSDETNFPTQPSASQFSLVLQDSRETTFESSTATVYWWAPQTVAVDVLEQAVDTVAWIDVDGSLQLGVTLSGGHTNLAGDGYVATPANRTLPLVSAQVNGSGPFIPLPVTGQETGSETVPISWEWSDTQSGQGSAGTLVLSPISNNYDAFASSYVVKVLYEAFDNGYGASWPESSDTVTLSFSYSTAGAQLLQFQDSTTLERSPSIFAGTTLSSRYIEWTLDANGGFPAIGTDSQREIPTVTVTVSDSDFQLDRYNSVEEMVDNSWQSVPFAFTWSDLIPGNNQQATLRLYGLSSSAESYQTAYTVTVVVGAYTYNGTLKWGASEDSVAISFANITVQPDPSGELLRSNIVDDDGLFIFQGSTSDPPVVLGDGGIRFNFNADAVNGAYLHALRIAGVQWDGSTSTPLELKLYDVSNALLRTVPLSSSGGLTSMTDTEVADSTWLEFNLDADHDSETVGAEDDGAMLMTNVGYMIVTKTTGDGAPANVAVRVDTNLNLQASDTYRNPATTWLAVSTPASVEGDTDACPSAFVLVITSTSDAVVNEPFAAFLRDEGEDNAHALMFNSSITVSGINPSATNIKYAVVEYTHGLVVPATSLEMVSDTAPSSGIALFTSSAAHGLSVGDYVRVAACSASYDTLSAVVATVPSVTTFTLVDTAYDVDVTGGVITRLPKITSAADSSGSALFTTDAAHGLAVDDWIMLRDMSVASYITPFHRVAQVPSSTTLYLDSMDFNGSATGAVVPISTAARRTAVLSTITFSNIAEKATDKVDLLVNGTGHDGSLGAAVVTVTDDSDGVTKPITVAFHSAINHSTAFSLVVLNSTGSMSALSNHYDMVYRSTAQLAPFDLAALKNYANSWPDSISFSLRDNSSSLSLVNGSADFDADLFDWVLDYRVGADTVGRYFSTGLHGTAQTLTQIDASTDLLRLPERHIASTASATGHMLNTTAPRLGDMITYRLGLRRRLAAAASDGAFEYGVFTVPLSRKVRVVHDGGDVFVNFTSANILSGSASHAPRVQPVGTHWRFAATDEEHVSAVALDNPLADDTSGTGVSSMLLVGLRKVIWQGPSNTSRTIFGFTSVKQTYSLLA